MGRKRSEIGEAKGNVRVLPRGEKLAVHPHGVIGFFLRRERVPESEERTRQDGDNSARAGVEVKRE